MRSVLATLQKKKERKKEKRGEEREPKASQAFISIDYEVRGKEWSDAREMILNYCVVRTDMHVPRGIQVGKMQGSIEIIFLNYGVALKKEEEEEAIIQEIGDARRRVREEIEGVESQKWGAVK